MRLGRTHVTFAEVWRPGEGLDLKAKRLEDLVDEAADGYLGGDPTAACIDPLGGLELPRPHLDKGAERQHDGEDDVSAAADGDEGDVD